MTDAIIQSAARRSNPFLLSDQGRPWKRARYLLKADDVTVNFRREEGGKIRVTSKSWDDAKVIMPNQVFEIASISTQVGIVRVDKLGGLSRH
jgi:hypothetical protein